jgi:DNA-binding winged helix-turn-helix (wHTH) protein
MSMSAFQGGGELYEFGPFRVDSRKEILLRAGDPVALTPKAFQILMVLVRHGKEVVTKDDLMKEVWPNTFVEEGNLSRNIFMLRKALGESPQDHQYILTVPGRGYRLAEDVRLVSKTGVSVLAAHHSKVQVHIDETNHGKWIAVAAILLLAAVCGASWMVLHRAPVLVEKGTIVLADFENMTGDPVFDGALRQGLEVQLEQSPFLSIIPEDHVQHTLAMMGQPAEAKLTPTIARELCRRTGSAAVIDGSISQIGTQYLLTLKAARCSSTETLASTEAQASDKNHVLDALGKMGSDIRSKLGETLSTIQKFDTPLEQATTPSLQALQAYSFGRRAMSRGGDWSAAVPFFQRAISLDPSFAMAYARLGMCYRNLHQTTLGMKNALIAYQLRKRASELEQFYIDSHYYLVAVADLEKARQVCELWAQTYPRDFTPRADLSDIYHTLGQYDRALAEAGEAVRLDANGVTYDELISFDISLNRLEEARSVAADAQAKKFNSPTLHLYLYQLAFLQNDAAAMARQVAWATGKPGAEDLLLKQEADTKAYFGQLRKARDLSRRAVDAAVQAEETEVAAGYEATTALREALFGNSMEARRRAGAALGLSNDRNTEYEAALAFGMAGDAARAQRLADDLAKRFPEDTLVRFSYLPTLRAQAALSAKDSLKTLEAMQIASPYGSGGSAMAPYPVYVCGLAYSRLGQHREAAVEFQEILNHPGIVVNGPIGALARLQLGRAYTMQGDTAKALAAYQDFLALWKDADADIPILKQARHEFATLH